AEAETNYSERVTQALDYCTEIAEQLDCKAWDSNTRRQADILIRVGEDVNAYVILRIENIRKQRSNSLPLYRIQVFGAPAQGSNRLFYQRSVFSLNDEDFQAAQLQAAFYA